MKLASLFSGGKDSTFAISKVRTDGHSVECLISLSPKSDESHLLHYPNIKYTSLQAKAMNIPQYFSESMTSDTETEIKQLQNMLQKCKSEFGIEGMVHGGLFSNYQRQYFEKIGNSLNLQVLSPLWHVNQETYLQELIESKFRFVVTSITSAGLDERWLGREITLEDTQKLADLSQKYHFNLSFEGGEAETFVIDCPLFSSGIKILQAKKIWDGYRGRFEITEAILNQ